MENLSEVSSPRADGESIDEIGRGAMADYTLTDARLHREVYIDLFRQYCEELLESDPSIAQYDFAALAEENLQSDTDHPYLIQAEGETAGLVVFMDEEAPADEHSCYTYLGELFVLEKFRGRGIAGRIFRDHLASQKYDVGLCYVRGSAAERFWLKRISETGCPYKVCEEDAVRDFIHIYLFGETEK